MAFQYFDIVGRVLATVEEAEREAMERSVESLRACVLSKRSIWVFGASHAGIMTEELFYRAGGLMLINPLFGRELMLDTKPVTHTSSMERLVGYGTQLANDAAAFGSGDVLIAHSVSGRNPVTIEVAMEAKRAGATVIALTNAAYSQSVRSRHPSGKRLYEVADIVLDNHGEIGDAAVPVDGIEQKVGPTSTVVGAAMLNAIVVELVQRLVEDGMDHPPVFYSANLDGGDERNRALASEYADCIHYRL